MEHVDVGGTKVPALGLGTWRLRGGACRRAVADALALGYRHLDTAQMYDNEAEVGAALRESGIDRDEVFVVTKVDNGNHAPAAVRSSVDESLRKLGEPIDLLLVHWPVEWARMRETLDAMLELVDEGTVRHVGVSNLTLAQLEEVRGGRPLFCDQVEHHPFRPQAELVAAARRDDFLVTAYSPLAKGRVADDPVLRDVAATAGGTPAQVALRWLLDEGPVAAIPKASSRDHLEENLGALDVRLDDDARTRVASLARR